MEKAGYRDHAGLWNTRYPRVIKIKLLYGLRPPFCYYKQWGIKKKNGQVHKQVYSLRFSKSGKVEIITENDVLKAALPIYHIDRTIKETGAMFGDEAHILYVNSQIKDDTELGKMMHDFSSTDAKDMHYQILADRVRYFKEDAKGVNICRAMEDMRKEAAAEQNILTLLETLHNLMKNLGWTAEQAMAAMGLNQKKVFLLKEFSKLSTSRSKLKIERWVERCFKKNPSLF